MLAAAAVVAAASMCGCGEKDRQPAEPEAEVMLRRMQSVDKLSLATMRITKMATVDDVKLDEANGMKQVAAAILDAVKIGDRKAAYSYDTYMVAYMDLSELRPGDITVDKDTKTVMIRLPKIEVELAGRDAGIREEHYRVTGLRSAISSEDRARLKEEMNRRLRQEVRENPEFTARLQETARRRAESFFGNLLADQGYKVTIIGGER